MEELSMQQLELKYRNRFIINILLLCTSVGLLYKGYILTQEITPNFFGSLNMLFVFMLALFCLYLNKNNRWLAYIPYINFSAIIILSGSLFLNGSREAVILTAYFVILVLAIYMSPTLTISGYVYGMLAHVYYLPKAGLIYADQPLNYLMFLLFFTVYSIATIFSYEFTQFLFQTVRYAQAKTKEQLIEQENKTKELQNREELFRQNVTAASNELRVPLERIIELATELRKIDASENAEESQRKLQNVLEEAQIIQDTIRKFDDMESAIENDSFVQFRPFQIEEVLRHQLDLLVPVTKEKSITIANQLSGAGPEKKGNWPVIYADYYCVNQIIHQVMLNVMQMTNKGAITISGKLVSKDQSQEMTCLELSFKHPTDPDSFDSEQAQIELDVINELISLQGGCYLQEFVVEKSRELRFQLPLARPESEIYE